MKRLILTGLIALWILNGSGLNGKLVVPETGLKYSHGRAGNQPVKEIEYYTKAARPKGQWLQLVKQELAAGHKPVLYFTATWCGPCKAFKKSLNHPLMTEALKNATLIVIDGDIDAEQENIAQKYGITAYPSYVRVDKTGKLIKKTDGGAWDENIPENMAPVLKSFLND